MAFLMDVEHMIDVALHTPEMGVVNFRVLHALLHVLCQRLQILDQKVEIRGQDADNMSNMSAIAKVPTLRLTEYILDEEKPVKPDDKGKATDETVIVVERYREGDTQADKSVVKRPSKTKLGKKLSGERLPGADITKRYSVPTITQFKDLETKVERLWENLHSMPDNETLLADARTTRSKSLMDIWQSMNVSARITTLEVAVEKLTSVTGDLAMEYQSVQDQLAGQQIVANVAGTGGRPGLFGPQLFENERMHPSNVGPGYTQMRLGEASKTLGAQESSPTGTYSPSFVPGAQGVSGTQGYAVVPGAEYSGVPGVPEILWAPRIDGTPGYLSAPGYAVTPEVVKAQDITGLASDIPGFPTDPGTSPKTIGVTETYGSPGTAVATGEAGAIIPVDRPDPRGVPTEYPPGVYLSDAFPPRVQAPYIYPPGELPQGVVGPDTIPYQYNPGIYPPGTFPPGTYPQGEFLSVALPSGVVPTIAFPPGALSPEAFPPGTLPPGTFPPGTFPPGTFPPGTFPPGTFPPGTFPPGTFPPGTFPPGTFPPGTFPPGTFPSGQYPPGVLPQGYQIQGGQSGQQEEKDLVEGEAPKYDGVTSSEKSEEDWFTEDMRGLPRSAGQIPKRKTKNLEPPPAPETVLREPTQVENMVPKAVHAEEEDEIIELEQRNVPELQRKVVRDESGPKPLPKYLEDQETPQKYFTVEPPAFQSEVPTLERRPLPPMYPPSENIYPPIQQSPYEPLPQSAYPSLPPNTGAQTNKPSEKPAEASPTIFNVPVPPLQPLPLSPQHVSFTPLVPQLQPTAPWMPQVPGPVFPTQIPPAVQPPDFGKKIYSGAVGGPEEADERKALEVPFVAQTRRTSQPFYPLAQPPPVKQAPRYPVEVEREITRAASSTMSGISAIRTRPVVRSQELLGRKDSRVSSREQYTRELQDIKRTLAGGLSGGRFSVTKLREDIDKLQHALELLADTSLIQPVNEKQVPCPDLLKEINLLKLRVEDLTVKARLLDTKIVDRVHFIESKIEENVTQMAQLDTVFNNQMNTFQDQVSDQERYIGELLLRIEKIEEENKAQDISVLRELQAKVSSFQDELESLNEMTHRLNEDREERQMHINALLEQIEILKSMKADRDELEDALADKADQKLLNRKVSHDQFDAACDDLGRGLEETLQKLSLQEAVWQHALDELQKEIDNKLDKLELSPLREFFNAKMRSLQERLKAIALMRRDAEAAGSKAKYLSNVNCISCDSNVVMSTTEDVPGVPQSRPLHPTRSIKPYLSYELDSVRKHQKAPPSQRNMRDWEAIHRGEMTRAPLSAPPTIITSADHLCNRYCGGSHTLTTATQRVTRLGHFVKQFGPEVVNLTTGNAFSMRGADGRVYKGSGLTHGSQNGKGDGPKPQYGTDLGSKVKTLQTLQLPSISDVSRKAPY